MSRKIHYSDSDDPNESEIDNDSDDPQWDDIADGDDDDALPEMMCPACRARLTEDTQKCPKCCYWITPVPHMKARARQLCGP
ncbi:MAG: hypothetical protein IPK83_21090 [Planctomycetes bacterium]|nr:hypothetical protein [Planctomycetota bacterium]